MGQLKFEKKFSDKLKEREIEPSSGSWENLRDRLDSEEKRKNPLFWWMGIAATIIGGILIFGSFFKEPANNNPGIVDVPAEKVEQKENGMQQNLSETKEEKTGVIAFDEKEEIIEPSGNAKAFKVSEEAKPTKKDNNGAVAEVNKSIKTKGPILEPEIIVAEVPEIPQPVQDAIAEVVLKESSGAITEAEVDALLALAAAEISESRNEKFTSENIDAGSLLREAEFEIEESFREMIFEAIKDGYLKARTAVANRNN